MRVTTRDPANMSLEAGADAFMDISYPAIPSVAFASRPVLVIEEAVAQTKTHVDANAEEPSTIGAYPARFAGLQLPWEDAEEISEPGPRQQQAPSPSLKSN